MLAYVFTEILRKKRNESTGQLFLHRDYRKFDEQSRSVMFENKVPF